jgi:16S rRNA (guanine(966)-N(2))-methyltransferase RsmD
MAVRLSSGAHRGKAAHEMRPTAARTLEAVFNMLMGEVANRRVLDLFAGVGSYGVFALKREAQLAVFVDNTRESEKRIQRAIEKYHLEESAMLFREDVAHFLHSTHRWDAPFDLIFADPPYSLVNPGELAEEILDSGLLAPEGVLIIEHSKRHAPPVIDGLKLRKSRVLGDTTVSIWDRSARRQ